MRRFVIVGHKAHSTADFKLDDLAGGAGRLDVLLRCVNSAFFLSHNIRTDAEVYLVLLGPEAPPRTVRFLGSEVRYLNPDERSTGALVRNALLKGGKGLIKSSPGVYVSDQSFHDVLQELAPKGQIVYLRENGVAIRDKELQKDVTFVLSDHKDLTPEEEAELESMTKDVVSLGPISYHADHCITIVNHEMDTRTF
ncbi:MAG: tRNA (pseudouridine(54)-N(1))-methyltransferase [Methanomassiliicoccales archaeon PtaU1.Bin124]|nr:MAG: tRNA (pseudouridine(54)-N(1))-methyltransferase [Methanomassiliicoccales archaeon PtaU1.Bin124]